MESVIYPLFAEAAEFPWDKLITVAGAVFMAWIAYKQVQLGVTQRELGANVNQIHKDTNSMREQLVKKTEAEAFARGGVVERARSDRERVQEGEDTMEAVTSELAKLTAATDARVEGVSEQVEQVDDKVEQVRDVVVDKPKGTEKES